MVYHATGSTYTAMAGSGSGSSQCRAVVAMPAHMERPEFLYHHRRAARVERQQVDAAFHTPYRAGDALSRPLRLVLHRESMALAAAPGDDPGLHAAIQARLASAGMAIRTRIRHHHHRLLHADCYAAGHTLSPATWPDQSAHRYRARTRADPGPDSSLCRENSAGRCGVLAAARNHRPALHAAADRRTGTRRCTMRTALCRGILHAPEPGPRAQGVHAAGRASAQPHLRATPGSGRCALRQSGLQSEPQPPDVAAPGADPGGAYVLLAAALSPGPLRFPGYPAGRRVRGRAGDLADHRDRAMRHQRRGDQARALPDRAV